MACRAGEGERDFVLADGRGGFEIEFGIEPEGFGEVDVAAGEVVTRTAEGDVAREQVDMPEDGGMLPGAAGVQIGFRLKLRPGPFHAGVRSGNGFDIELEIAQESRVRDGSGSAFARGHQERAEIKALGKDDAVHGHAAGKERGLRGSGETQRASDEPAHPFGIAQPDARGDGSDVVVQGAFAVLERAGELQAAAAGFRRDFFEKHACGIEHEIAAQVRKPRGEIAITRRSIGHVDFSVDARPVERAAKGGVDLGRAARIQVGEKAGGET